MAIGSAGKQFILDPENVLNVLEYLWEWKKTDHQISLSRYWKKQW